MTDYIKRIQSNLSSKNIKVGRPLIREELELLGYTNETLTSELIPSIVESLQEKFINLNDSESVNTELAQELELNSFAPGDEEINKNNSSLPIPETEENNSLEIVVTQEDKHDVIVAQAQAYGIELSEVEVLELTSNVGDRFTDYMDFVFETKQVIKSYAEQRYDSLERKIDDTSEDLKSYFEQREKQLNQKLATGLGEINNFFRSRSSKQKELSKIIADRFKLPTG